MIYIYKCVNCGFKAEFDNIYMIALFNTKFGHYYVDCPFCKEQMIDINFKDNN